MQANHMTAIVLKDMKDTLRNIQVLILFFVFPIIGFVMTQSINEQSVFFVSIFATMHIVFTPIVVTASMIAEEKERNTLRVLRMSGITSVEFFASTALFVLILDGISSLPFLLMGSKNEINIGLFFSAVVISGVISIVIGMCIGIYSKSASAANGLAVPVGMVFAFIPMLSGFNEALGRVSKYLYGQQMSFLILGKPWNTEAIVICIANFILIVTLYIVLFEKSKKVS